MGISDILQRYVGEWYWINSHAELHSYLKLKESIGLKCIETRGSNKKNLFYFIFERV